MKNYTKQTLKRIFEMIKEEIPYKQDGNIIHFITDDDERPYWSKALNGYFVDNQIELQMSLQYEKQRTYMTQDKEHRRFVDTVASNHGVIVDLASGPSGYFAPILDAIGKQDLFVVADACPAVIAAHSAACLEKNMCIFDVDLDKRLPFQDECVDCFCGNLLNNVTKYADLVREAYRCLKKGGCFAVIEIFFEHGGKTYEYLRQQNAIWASFETYISFCESLGLKYIDGDTLRAGKGKMSEGDALPLDDSDCWKERTLYFKKIV